MAKKENKEKNKNNFLKELKAELKKVTWPTFKKLVNNTSAVISIVLIVSVVVFVLDVCFENLNSLGIERLKAVVASDTETENVENTENTADLSEGIDLVTDDENQVEENAEQENTEAQTENHSENEVAQ